MTSFKSVFVQSDLANAFGDKLVEDKSYEEFCNTMSQFIQDDHVRKQLVAVVDSVESCDWNATVVAAWMTLHRAPSKFVYAAYIHGACLPQLVSMFMSEGRPRHMTEVLQSIEKKHLSNVQVLVNRMTKESTYVSSLMADLTRIVDSCFTTPTDMEVPTVGIAREQPVPIEWRGKIPSRTGAGSRSDSRPRTSGQKSGKRAPLYKRGPMLNRENIHKAVLLASLSASYHLYNRNGVDVTCVRCDVTGKSLSADLALVREYGLVVKVCPAHMIPVNELDTQLCLVCQKNDSATTAQLLQDAEKVGFCTECLALPNIRMQYDNSYEAYVAACEEAKAAGLSLTSTSGKRKAAQSAATDSTPATASSSAVVVHHDDEDASGVSDIEEEMEEEEEDEEEDQAAAPAVKRIAAPAKSIPAPVKSAPAAAKPTPAPAAAKPTPAPAAAKPTPAPAPAKSTPAPAKPTPASPAKSSAAPAKFATPASPAKATHVASARVQLPPKTPVREPLLPSAEEDDAGDYL